MRETTKLNNVRYCGGPEQDAMISRGWHIVVAENGRETDQQLFDRCRALGYKQVKVYYSTTAVRGYHSIFAMVKR